MIFKLCQFLTRRSYLLPILDDTFLEFDFEACLNLRVFEVRINSPSYTLDNLILWLCRVLSTIKSPVFSKFILSLDWTMSEPNFHLLEPAKTSSLDRWLFLLFRGSRTLFIIKGGLPLNWRHYLMLCFPSSTYVNAIRFDFPYPDAVPQCGRAR